MTVSKITAALLLALAAQGNATPVSDVIANQYAQLNGVLGLLGLSLPAGDNTVFAPSDAAFATATAGDGAALTYAYNKDLLTQIVLLHVTPGAQDSTAVLAQKTFEMLSTESLTFADDLTISGGDSVLANLVAEELNQATTGGHVHGIDKVMVYPGTLVGTSLLDVVDAAQLTTLKDLVVNYSAAAASLVSTVVDSPGATVFAPTNEAFTKFLEKYPIIAENLATEEAVQKAVEQVIFHHVLAVPGEDTVITSDQVTTGTVPTLNGDMDIVVEGGSVMIGDAKVISADNRALNGVAHVVDMVLEPHGFENAVQNVVDIAVTADAYTTLVSLVQAADLVTPLQSNKDLTVFAPTNTAFGTVGAAAEYLQYPHNKDLLQSVLLYHVLDSAVDFATFGTLADGAEVDTLLGQKLTVRAGKGFTDALGREVDIDASVGEIRTNAESLQAGYIHTLSGVLLPDTLPASNTIVDVAVDNGFTVLAAAATRAGLIETLSELSSSAAFTVFAPTDAAFKALLGENAVAEVQAMDVEALADLLKYHVVAGVVTSGNLVNGKATTLAGTQIEIDLTNGVTLNGDTTVTLADVRAYNGVVHAVDKVLTPPEEKATPAPTPEDTGAAYSVAPTVAAIATTLAVAFKAL